MESVDPELTEFCRSEWPKLVAVLSLFTGDRDLAEDLAQEAILRACIHWPKVRLSDSRSACLSRVAFNLAATVAKRSPHFAADQFSPRDCVARGFPGLTARELLFTDQGRVFDLHVVVGDNVSRTTEQQLYAMLDTLRFTSR